MLQVLAHNDRLAAAAAAAANTTTTTTTVTVNGTVNQSINLEGILVGNGVTGQGSMPHDVSLRLGVEFLYGHGLWSALQQVRERSTILCTVCTVCTVLYLLSKYL